MAILLISKCRFHSCGIDILGSKSKHPTPTNTTKDSLTTPRPWSRRVNQSPHNTMLTIPPLITILLSFLAAILGIISYSNGPTTVTILDLFCPYTRSCLNQFISPHYSSWDTWFHHSQYLFPKTSPGRDRRKDWNLLYHLDGNGPWIEKVDGDGGDGVRGIKPPEGCVVEQVHLV